MTWQRRARIAKHPRLRAGLPPAPRAGRGRSTPGGGYRAAGQRDRRAPPALPGHRGVRERGAEGAKTRRRRPKGRGGAPCAPRFPDSPRYPPAAASAPTAGSHRRVSALPEPSQLPRRASLVPSGHRPCPGGFGSPLPGRWRGSPTRPRSPGRGAAARRQQLGQHPARQREGRCGPGSPVPERRCRPARGSAPLLPGKPRRGNPGGAARYGRGESKRRQLLCAPSLPQGCLWVLLFFLVFVCWLVGWVGFWGGLFFFSY